MPTFEDFWRDLSKMATGDREIVRSPSGKLTHYVVLEVAPDFAVIHSAKFGSKLKVRRWRFEAFWEYLSGNKSQGDMLRETWSHESAIRTLFLYLNYVEEGFYARAPGTDRESWAFLNPRIRRKAEPTGILHLEYEKPTQHFSLVRTGQIFLHCEFDEAAGNLIVRGTGRVSGVEFTYRRTWVKDPFGGLSLVQIRAHAPESCSLEVDEYIRVLNGPSMNEIGLATKRQHQWEASSEPQIVPLSPDEYELAFLNIASAPLPAGVSGDREGIFEIVQTSGDSDFLKERIKRLSKANRESPLAPSTAETVRRAPDRGIRDSLKALYNHQCQICGFTFRQQNGRGYSETHHIVSVSEGGQHTDENLLVLCPNHHKMLELGEGSDVDLKHGRIVLLGEPTELKHDEHLFVTLLPEESGD